MEYQGTWNASTNSPTLADGTGSTGDVYRVGTAGSQDLGSGSISFTVGDYAIYNGSTWEKADTTDAVSSVNGATGAVTVNAINELTGDVTASAASGSQSKVATIAAGVIVDSKISASAAIAVSKLAAGTNNYVLTTVAGVPTWAVTSSSVSAFKANWITADGTTKAITHSLGSTDCIVQVFDSADGSTIGVEVVRTSSNVVTLTSSEAPGVSWRVLILAI
jgi:hypothetical protein